MEKIKVEAKEVEDYGVYFPKKLKVFGNRMVINRDKILKDDIKLFDVILHELLHHLVDKCNITTMEGVATVVANKWEELNARAREIEQRINNKETSFMISEL